MKQKTAMTEHIESMQRFIQEHDVKDIDQYPGAMAITILEYAIEDAKRKLALEKEQVEQAFVDGVDSGSLMDSNTYYQDTYVAGK